MNKAIKEKAKYVVRAKAGTDRSSEYSALIAWLLKLVYQIKANYWLWRVNRMTEGEIMNIYYDLTRKDGESCDDLIRRIAGNAHKRAAE